MNILVIAPMRVEADNFIKALKGIEHHNYYKVSCVGVGKVNAASNTALELYGCANSKRYDLVAVIGYAGASSRFKQGDFVIPMAARYHDVSVPVGIVDELNKVFKLEGSDEVIILTGDSFVTKSNVSFIQSKFGGSSFLFDMESAAVAQVAGMEDIPVVVLKLVSDIPSNKNNLLTFEEFVENNSNFSQFVHYLEAL